MPNPKLKEIVETFTEEELALTVPIDFQDVSVEDFSYVNQYNKYLTDGNYQAALEYRTANADIVDKYIFDAKKMNYLQILVINAYMFAKGEKSAVNTTYDNSETGIEANNLQEALDYILLNHKTYEILTKSQYEDKGDAVHNDGIMYYVN